MNNSWKRTGAAGWARIRGMASVGVLCAGIGLGLAVTTPVQAQQHDLKAVQQDVYGKDGLKRWLPKARHGDLFAQYVLGHMYCAGRGVKQDYGEGLKWYKRAAAQGFAPGQLALGTLYYQGTGVKQDYGEAVKWFRMAAEQGYARAQNNLASLYYLGQGVGKDYKQALHWYRAAAAQGYERAQYNLGLMYAQGVGLSKPDQVAGYALLSLLKERGDKAASKSCKTLGASLSSDQIDQAHKLAEKMRGKGEMIATLDARR